MKMIIDNLVVVTFTLLFAVMILGLIGGFIYIISLI